MSKPHPYLVLVTLCVACGSSFQASDGGAGSGGGADAGAAGAAASPSAGSTAGGSDPGGSAGEPSGGATAAGSGGTTSAGSGGATTAGSGGASAGSGGGTNTDCATLKTEYAALVKKARVCAKDMPNTCSTSSTVPPVGCGCPTLVNPSSEYTALAKKKYQAIQDGMCDLGPVCGIACIAPTGAECSQSTGSGNSEYVCTGTNGGVMN